MVGASVALPSALAAMGAENQPGQRIVDPGSAGVSPLLTCQLALYAVKLLPVNESLVRVGNLYGVVWQRHGGKLGIAGDGDTISPALTTSCTCRRGCGSAPGYSTDIGPSGQDVVDALVVPAARPGGGKALSVHFPSKGPQ